MRLRRRPRFDTLQNEARKRGRSLGRWIYLGLVCALLFWVFDMFLGKMIYFRAEGLVLRDRIVIATQYPAGVQELNVEEGSSVKEGKILARVRSQRVEESLAQLYSDLANGLGRSTELQVRGKVIEAISPMVDRSYDEARHARVASERLRDKQLLTIGRRAELLKGEIDSARTRSEVLAERRAIEDDLPDLLAAVEAAEKAVARLQQVYSDGVLKAPADGIIGYLHVSEGSVVQMGEPLMEIFTGTPYVLAYVPEGALYELHPGDPINISLGFKDYHGRVDRIYPVAGQLPKEFQNTFEPVARARIVRIEFEPNQPYPSLFSKTTLSAAGWPPAWLARLATTSYSDVAEDLTTMRSNINALSQQVRLFFKNVPFIKEYAG